MRSLRLLLISVSFLFCETLASRPVYGQQNSGDIKDKVCKLTGVCPQNTRSQQIPAAPFQAVTTSIKDAFPLANWLDDYSRVMQPHPTTSLNVNPGYYRITVRSYCLHAGAYAPTRGAAYRLSPLKGTQAGLITSMLKKSERSTQKLRNRTFNASSGESKQVLSTHNILPISEIVSRLCSLPRTSLPWKESLS